MVFKIFAFMLLPFSVLASETALVLWYGINEPGFAPYRMRYLITEKYLRSDDGQENNDFVLLDREKMTIYNVVHETESVLEIKAGAEIPIAPASLKAKESLSEAKDAPTISGKRAKEYRLTVEDTQCFRAMVLPGLYDDAAKALQQFATVLAGQQLRSLKYTPEGVLSSCFIARAIYKAGNHARAGLPIVEWDDEGFSRQLVDFSEQKISAVVFMLPEDYLIYAPGGQRSLDSVE